MTLRQEGSVSNRSYVRYTGKGEWTYTTLREELTVFAWGAPKTKNFPNTSAVKNAPTVPVYTGTRNNQRHDPETTETMHELTPIARRSLSSAGTDTTPLKET